MGKLVAQRLHKLLAARTQAGIAWYDGLRMHHKQDGVEASQKVGPSQTLGGGSRRGRGSSGQQRKQLWVGAPQHRSGGNGSVAQTPGRQWSSRQGGASSGSRQRINRLPSILAGTCPELPSSPPRVLRGCRQAAMQGAAPAALMPGSDVDGRQRTGCRSPGRASQSRPAPPGCSAG